MVDLANTSTYYATTQKDTLIMTLMNTQGIDSAYRKEKKKKQKKHQVAKGVANA